MSRSPRKEEQTTSPPHELKSPRFHININGLASPTKLMKDAFAQTEVSLGVHEVIQSPSIRSNGNGFAHLFHVLADGSTTLIDLTDATPKIDPQVLVNQGSLGLEITPQRVPSRPVLYPLQIDTENVPDLDTERGWDSDDVEVPISPQSDLGVSTPTFDTRSEVSAASRRPAASSSPRLSPLSDSGQLSISIPEVHVVPAPDTTQGAQIDTNGSAKLADDLDVQTPAADLLTPKAGVPIRSLLELHTLQPKAEEVTKVSVESSANPFEGEQAASAPLEETPPVKREDERLSSVTREPPTHDSNSGVDATKTEVHQVKEHPTVDAELSTPSIRVESPSTTEDEAIPDLSYETRRSLPPFGGDEFEDEDDADDEDDEQTPWQDPGDGYSAEDERSSIHSTVDQSESDVSVAARHTSTSHTAAHTESLDYESDGGVANVGAGGELLAATRDTNVDVPSDVGDTDEQDDAEESRDLNLDDTVHAKDTVNPEMTTEAGERVEEAGDQENEGETRGPAKESSQSAPKGQNVPADSSGKDPDTGERLGDPVEKTTSEENGLQGTPIVTDTTSPSDDPTRDKPHEQSAAHEPSDVPNPNSLQADPSQKDAINVREFPVDTNSRSRQLEPTQEQTVVQEPPEATNPNSSQMDSAQKEPATNIHEPSVDADSHSQRLELTQETPQEQTGMQDPLMGTNLELQPDSTQQEADELLNGSENREDARGAPPPYEEMPYMQSGPSSAPMDDRTQAANAEHDSSVTGASQPLVDESQERPEQRAEPPTEKHAESLSQSEPPVNEVHQQQPTDTSTVEDSQRKSSGLDVASESVSATGRAAEMVNGEGKSPAAGTTESLLPAEGPPAKEKKKESPETISSSASPSEPPQPSSSSSDQTAEITKGGPPLNTSNSPAQELPSSNTEPTESQESKDATGSLAAAVDSPQAIPQPPEGLLVQIGTSGDVNQVPSSDHPVLEPQNQTSQEPGTTAPLTGEKQTADLKRSSSTSTNTGTITELSTISSNRTSIMPSDGEIPEITTQNSTLILSSTDIEDLLGHDDGESPEKTARTGDLDLHSPTSQRSDNFLDSDDEGHKLDHPVLEPVLSPISPRSSHFRFPSLDTLSDHSKTAESVLNSPSSGKKATEETETVPSPIPSIKTEQDEEHDTRGDNGTEGESLADSSTSVVFHPIDVEQSVDANATNANQNTLNVPQVSDTNFLSDMEEEVKYPVLKHVKGGSTATSPVQETVERRIPDDTDYQALGKASGEEGDPKDVDADQAPKSNFLRPTTDKEQAHGDPNAPVKDGSSGSSSLPPENVAVSKNSGGAEAREDHTSGENSTPEEVSGEHDPSKTPLDSGGQVTDSQQPTDAPDESEEVENQGVEHSEPPTTTPVSVDPTVDGYDDREGSSESSESSEGSLISGPRGSQSSSSSNSASGSDSETNSDEEGSSLDEGSFVILDGLSSPSGSDGDGGEDIEDSDDESAFPGYWIPDRPPRTRPRHDSESSSGSAFFPGSWSIR